MHIIINSRYFIYLRSATRGNATNDFTGNMKGDWFKMNKKIKRLSIIAMVMIAMIIGINNVNALKVDNTAISQSGKYSATDGGAQVNVTKINSKYTIISAFVAG